MSDKRETASGFQFGLANLKPVSSTENVTLTFPDGAQRQFPQNTTGLDIAKGISPRVHFCPQKAFEGFLWLAYNGLIFVERGIEHHGTTG